MARKLRISFTLDETDTAYFEKIYRAAKQNASPDDWPKISRGVKRLIKEVRTAKKVPSFVVEAITALEDCMLMVDDDQYKAPKAVVSKAVAGLAYFANAKDVIPDDIPMMGFLDDAIMIRFLEEDLAHELWGYRQFRKFRDGAEQRDWTDLAKKRLPPRLEAKRKEIRAKIQVREEKAKSSKKGLLW